MAVLDDFEMKAVRPDALAPAEIEAKAEAVAIGKTKTPVAKLLVLSMLAGAFIAFGALYFCVFLGDPSMPFAVQRIVGGLCFSLGLVLVLCCGAELFTGNMLMVCALASKKITAGAMAKNWALVWLGNLAGALVAVALVYFAHIADMNGGGVGNAMVSVAVSKVTPDWTTLFFKGILCNIFVCLAVWIGFATRTVVDKVVGILLPISAFVACGFEHCVANMFFLPMGLLAKGAGFGAQIDASALDLGSVFCNISAATLGNIVGGAIFVGLAYWFVFHTKKES